MTILKVPCMTAVGTLLKKNKQAQGTLLLPVSMSALSNSPGRKQTGIIQAPKVSVYARPKQALLITEPMSILRNRVVHCYRSLLHDQTL